MPKRWGAMVAVAAVLGLGSFAGCGGSGADAEIAGLSKAQADALVQRLRRPGNVLLMRHAATDSAADITADFDDCSRQRNLSADGRRQSATIRTALRRLRVSIDQNRTSPFCRTRETAELITGEFAFGSRALLPPDVFETVKTDDDGPGYSLRGMVRGWAAEPSVNTLMVSHESAIAKATGLTLDEGEMLVIRRAKRPPGFRVLARLMPRDWQRLAER